jgi:signal transduction histidine kinase
MAHEVNNSLDTMQNCLHLLDGQVKPDAEATYELLRTEAARLTRMVREILGLYRQAQPAGGADFNAIVVQTLRTQHARLHSGNIKVTTRLMSVPRLPVPPAQLRMVASNLIVNAADAMPAGGKLRIETRLRKGKVLLRLTDTGIGIPRALESRIFQPFVTSKAGRGAGLGLWIVDQIVSHHRGVVRALPHLGGGSIFEVELPAPTMPSKQARAMS